MRKQSPAQVQGRDGERWFQRLLPAEWLFQRPSEDFGLDGTVVIGVAGYVTHLEFGVQIKSGGRWKVHDGHYLVPGVKVDAIRNWVLHLLPTLFVVYDRTAEMGCWSWVDDLVSQDEIAHSASDTVTLRVPRRSLLNESSWLQIQSYVAMHHASILDAGHNLESLRALMQVVRALVRSLQLLQLAPFANRRSETQRRLTRVGDATAHRTVIRKLTEFADRLHTDEPLAGYLRKASAAYRAHCETFIHPFADLLSQDHEAVAIWINDDRMRELRPMMALAVSAALAELTSTR
ncbi:MAG TPA: DUF4365 domain-containing protein [Thermoanaerobaculia bacterium]|nr:DUF4365 domain-containing protein [Thermoanaerobaculia bacterium]